MSDQFNDDVKRIVERRNESRKWWENNYYSEFEEVYRSSKCRTLPIMYKDDNGNDVEDLARTNVCMPDTAVIIRRNTARMTAEPPKIRFTCRNNVDLAEKLSAWSLYQYDRSGEAWVQRKHVQQEETFGFSYTKLYWDKVSQVRSFRFQRDQIHDRLPGVLQGAGYSPEEIQAEVGKLPPREQDIQGVLQQGSEVNHEVNLKKYEGPMVKFVFIGDIFPEPGFRSLNESNWVVESYVENDQWLKYWAEQTYCDPDSGQEIPVFDSKIVLELLGMPNMSPIQDIQDLRTRLKAVSGSSTSEFLDLGDNARLMRGKRFNVLECHETREDGRKWISWVVNEKYFLGEMPYPWDLYGKWVYTEFIGLPDLITGIGDSTPRLGRFLQSLHNVAVNQRTDLVTNILRPLIFRRYGSDVPDQVIERALFRIIDVKDPSDFTIPREPDAPMSAWETENQIVRMFGTLDGALTNIESGTNLNPQSGKTATTAVLQQRSVDAMTQYKLDGLNLYFKEVTEKKLAMLQQFLSEPLQIANQYAKTEGLRHDESGQIANITIDPYEIQEDIEVEPEASSTLSVDDEFRRMAAEKLYQLASTNPVVWNLTEVAKFLASTVKGVDAKKMVNPPAQPPPPPPKGNITLAIKWMELPGDVQNNLLQLMGLPPSQEVLNEHILNTIGKASVAADAATNLMSPAQPTTAPPDQNPEEGAAPASKGEPDGSKPPGKGFLRASTKPKSGSSGNSE